MSKDSMKQNQKESNAGDEMLCVLLLSALKAVAECRLKQIERGVDRVKKGDIKRSTGDPCANEYAAMLAAQTAYIQAIEAAESAQQNAMNADMAYETCVMENTGVGIDDPPIDPPDMPAEP